MNKDKEEKDEGKGNIGRTFGLETRICVEWQVKPERLFIFRGLGSVYTTAFLLFCWNFNKIVRPIDYLQIESPPAQFTLW